MELVKGRINNQIIYRDERSASRSLQKPSHRVGKTG